MNYEELIESLWLEAEKKIEAMLRETAEEESQIEKEAMLTVNHIRNDGHQVGASDSVKRKEEILAEAERESRVISIETNVMLAERLNRISRSFLPGLREREYDEIFRSLAAELPSHSWKEVRINPEDSALAREHFPGAEIIPDALITGGMDVSSVDSKIRVINTFEKRLERAWEDIIPDLLKGVYETA